MDEKDEAAMLKRMARVLLRAHGDETIGVLVLVSDDTNNTLEVLSHGLTNDEANSLLSASLDAVLASAKKIDAQMRMN